MEHKPWCKSYSLTKVNGKEIYVHAHACNCQTIAKSYYESYDRGNNFIEYFYENNKLKGIRVNGVEWKPVI
jgi:hypothetical protein